MKYPELSMEEFGKVMIDEIFDLFSEYKSYTPEWPSDSILNDEIDIETYGDSNDPQYMHLYFNSGKMGSPNMITFRKNVKVPSKMADDGVLEIKWFAPGTWAIMRRVFSLKDGNSYSMKGIYQYISDNEYMSDEDKKPFFIMWETFKRGYEMLHYESIFDRLHILCGRFWTLESFGENYMRQNFVVMDSIRKKLYERKFTIKPCDANNCPTTIENAESLMFSDEDNKTLTQLKLISINSNINHSCSLNATKFNIELVLYDVSD